MIPFSRLYLILSSHTFQLFIAQHSLVQFLLHLVEEIGTAFVLAAFHIQIGIVAVSLFNVHPEYPTEKAANSLIVVSPSSIQRNSCKP